MSKFSCLLLGNGFLHVTPKAGAMKEKVDKLDFFMVKNTCASKNIIKKIKRQVKECDIFKLYI